jgi:AbrB family looped-hinge helix DNA binding protein
MARTTITSKGQVTVPKTVRDRLGWSTGDSLEFLIEADGTVVVRSVSRAREVFGLLHDFAPSEPVSIAEMHDTVRDRAIEKTRHRS